MAIEGALLIPWLAMSLLAPAGSGRPGLFTLLCYLPQLPGALIVGGEGRTIPGGGKLVLLYLVQSGIYALVVRVLMIFVRGLFTMPTPTGGESESATRAGDG